MLLRNILWNLMGEGLPMVAAVASIPLLIQAIGMERFGALTLLWALLGYLALLDMGLVRSLVQVVAERLGGREPPGPSAANPPPPGSIAEVVFPVFSVIAGLGLLAAAGLVVFAAPLAHRLEADAALAEEVKTSLYIAAGIVPAALLSAGLRGLLEAHQHFRATNLVRMSVGVLNYLSPLAVLPFSSSLPAVLAAVALGRVLGLVALGVLCRRLVALDGPWFGSWSAAARPVFAMGAWMMAGNLIGPLMMYADRFILGAMVTTGAVAYYTTPFEMVTRLLFFPAAIAGVLFPLAARNFRRAPQTLPRILGLGTAAVLGAYGAAMIAVAVGGRSLLDVWLGADFAANSGPILSVLMLGVLFNGAAYMPYVMLQGVGRVDITAKLQIVELPFYLLVLWGLVQAYGPLGAAMAWSLRTAGDFFLMLFFFSRQAPQAAAMARRIGVVTGLAAATTALGLGFGGALGLSALLTAQGGVIALAAAFLWRARRDEVAILASAYATAPATKAGDRLAMDG